MLIDRVKTCNYFYNFIQYNLKSLLTKNED